MCAARRFGNDAIDQFEFEQVGCGDEIKVYD